MNADAIAAYVRHMAEIDNIARHLADYAGDHGNISPDDVDWMHVGSAGEIVRLLTAACEQFGIDLSTEED